MLLHSASAPSSQSHLTWISLLLLPVPCIPQIQHLTWPISQCRVCIRIRESNPGPWTFVLMKVLRMVKCKQQYFPTNSSSRENSSCGAGQFQRHQVDWMEEPSGQCFTTSIWFILMFFYLVRKDELSGYVIYPLSICTTSLYSRRKVQLMSSSSTWSGCQLFIHNFMIQQGKTSPDEQL